MLEGQSLYIDGGGHVLCPMYSYSVFLWLCGKARVWIVRLEAMSCVLCIVIVGMCAYMGGPEFV